MKIQSLLDRTFWKFIMVGCINTLVGTGVMFISYNYFRLSYWISSALNYIIGSLVSYLLNKHFTFRNKQKGWRYIVTFAVNIAVCYFIAYGLAKPFVNNVLSGRNEFFRDNIAMIVGMCLFVGLNYLGQRFIVFADKSEQPAAVNNEDPPGKDL